MTRRELLVSLQGIGNGLLALPLAAALRRGGSDVTMLVYSPRLVSVLRYAPMVSGVIAADEPNYRGLTGRRRLVAELRRRGFDRAVFAFPSGRAAYHLIRLADIRERIGHAYPEVGRTARWLTQALTPLRKGHDLDQNLQLAEELGLEHRASHLWPILEIPEEIKEKGRAYLEGAGLDPNAQYLGLHPGGDGRWVEKRWPADHFAKIAELVYEKYRFPAIVFDGPAEAGAGLLIKRRAKSPVHALDGWGNLADAWSLMAFCSVFVANDSGLMNLACASGLPVAAVFGPSEVHRTRPYGARGRAIVSDRTCAPCFDLGRYPGCPYPYHHCMPGIEPRKVFETIEDLLRT